jgi:hypothetical protein
MKRQVKKVPFAAWGIVLLIAVCVALNAQEADTWLPVTRMNQIAGNWEGSSVIDIPAAEEAMMPAISMDLTFSFWYVENADEIEMQITVDFSRFLTDWSPSIGVSPSALWEITCMGLRQSVEQNDGIIKLEFGEYVAYYSQVFPVEKMVADGDSMLINTDGTKLRFRESASVEIGEFNLSSFVMHRK